MPPLKALRISLFVPMSYSNLVYANLELDPLFIIEKLKNRIDRHSVTAPDFSIPAATDGRVHIIDTDTGDYLGMFSTGYWYSGVNLPRTEKWPLASFNQNAKHYAFISSIGLITLPDSTSSTAWLISANG